MNTTVLKMLEEFDDFAVRGIDSEIAEFQELLEVEPKLAERNKLSHRIAKLKVLRKQILWGV